MRGKAEEGAIARYAVARGGEGVRATSTTYNYKPGTNIAGRSRCGHADGESEHVGRSEKASDIGQRPQSERVKGCSRVFPSTARKSKSSV